MTLPHIAHLLKGISKHDDPRIPLVGWVEDQARIAFGKITQWRIAAPQDRMECAYEAANDLLELHQIIPATIKALRETDGDGRYKRPISTKPKGPNHRKKKKR